MSECKVLLLTNWGLGSAILSTMLAMPEASVTGVVTRFASGSPDAYADMVRLQAVAAGIPTYDQRTSDMAVLQQLIRSGSVDLLLVHAYLRILPREVFTMPRLGAVNIHASLLPRHRGRDPVSWALECNDTHTGLTAHHINDGVDSGGVIHQIAVPLVRGDDRASVLERMKALVAPLLHETVRRIGLPGFTAQPQNEALATWAPKIQAKGQP